MVICIPPFPGVGSVAIVEPVTGSGVATWPKDNFLFSILDPTGSLAFTF